MDHQSLADAGSKSDVPQRPHKGHDCICRSYVGLVTTIQHGQGGAAYVDVPSP